MGKTFYRYFFGSIKKQENWLNHMASQGYKLIKVGKCSYTFETCKEDEWQYCIEFVAHMSFHQSKDYVEFLKEQGYNIFYKNLNLSWSIGKIRWRPYGQGAGQITTNPGSFNREILIVEKKKDGELFELHSTSEDKVAYYKSIRNAWLSISIFLCIATAYRYYSVNMIDFYVLLCGAISFICLIFTVLWQNKIITIKKNADIQEN